MRKEIPYTTISIINFANSTITKHKTTKQQTGKRNEHIVKSEVSFLIHIKMELIFNFN